MSQPFPCNCATPSCVGEISGAGQMSAKALEGKWLSAHIRRALEEKRDGNGIGNVMKNGEKSVNGKSNGVNGKKSNGEVNREGEINGRRGVTSREMSGEMGGDTL
ncbi:hypothetical protein BTUL_0319g00100 [Botrytis tulipae]|uniref:Post-SET domain-containing protein n=1 Tax=Botrytis tulipae TaxID=87230 RepID=A0A4Z1E7G2_9HELO|nr:hypothetical protein BTUL_0319g00100 [Botrytis tulipae]